MGNRQQGSDICHLEHQTNTTTNVTVPLHDEFNRNKETETNKNERITKTNGRSMKYRNTDNFDICNAFFLDDVCYASNLKGAAGIQSYVRLWISVA